MKRRIFWISFILVCILILTACDSILPPPLTAKQLERRVDRKMNDLQSYRIDVEMKYTVYVNANKVTGTATGFMLEDKGEGKDDYYSYIEMTNETKSGSTTIRLRNVDAYHEGIAYSLFGDGKVTRRLSAKMTRAEYDTYRDGDSLVEINLQDCDKIEMERTDTGYVLKYSDYSAEAVEEFAQASGLEKEVFGEDLRDLHVTMEVSKDYLPVMITLDPVFDYEEGEYYQSKVAITMTFSQFNEVERITKSFSTMQYTEIESLQLLKDFEQLIDDRIEAQSGSFTSTTSQNATFMAQTDKQSQTSKVSFERTEGGLTFSADVTDEAGASSHIKYKDGEKITEANGKTHTGTMSEDKAEAFIADLIHDPAMGYNINYVSNIEKTEQGYLVTMAVSKYSAMGQSIASMGATFGNGKHTIEFVLNGDELKAIKVEYSGQGIITLDFGWSSSNATLHFDGSTTVTFDK